MVDVSPYFDKKLEAINCFASQFQGDLGEIEKLFPAWAKLIDRVRTQMKFCGHQAGVEYAEPFVIKELIAIDDVVDIPVPSI